MMRCMIVLFVVALSVAVFAEGTKEGAQGAAAKSTGGTIVLRLADNAAPNHPNTLGDKEFARLVSERTGGRN